MTVEKMARRPFSTLDDEYLTCAFRSKHIRYTMLTVPVTGFVIADRSVNLSRTHRVVE